MGAVITLLLVRGHQLNTMGSTENQDYVLTRYLLPAQTVGCSWWVPIEVFRRPTGFRNGRRKMS